MSADRETHTPDDELPTLHDVKRLGKWGTGGQSAVEFLRRIRSETESMKAELHAAFLWDCDECGIENVVRSIEGNLDEAALEEASENRIVTDLVAPDVEFNEAEDRHESRFLVQRIYLCPQFVTCKNCGASFETEVAMED